MPVNFWCSKNEKKRFGTPSAEALLHKLLLVTLKQLDSVVIEDIFHIFSGSILYKVHSNAQTISVCHRLFYKTLEVGFADLFYDLVQIAAAEDIPHLIKYHIHGNGKGRKALLTVGKGGVEGVGGKNTLIQH